MGIPMNYGLCKGGPWNNKHLAHGEPTYLVAIDRHSKKPMIGVLQTSATQESFTFGTYRWAPFSKEWIWFKAPDEAS